MSAQKCPFNHELLASYSSGNISLKDRTVVERHLATCELCRREVVELEKIWWSLDVWQDEVQHAPLRFNELKLRLEASQTVRQSWMQVLKSYLPEFNKPFQWAPTAVLAGIVGVLILLPFMRGTVVQEGSMAAGDDPKITVATDQEMEPSNSQLTDMRSEAEKERLFQEALQESEQELKQLIRLGQGGSLHMAGLGSIPNKNVFSSIETTSFTPNPAVYNMVRE